MARLFFYQAVHSAASGKLLFCQRVAQTAVGFFHVEGIGSKIRAEFAEGCQGLVPCFTMAELVGFLLSKIFHWHTCFA